MSCADVQGGISSLLDPSNPLRLYGGEGNLVSYNYSWSSVNSTAPSCLVTSGPYLTVQPGCLVAGGTYTFRLVVNSPEGRTGAKQVRHMCLKSLD